MSLQVWLPLNKENDFNNRGLANISITNKSATYDNSGKIGGCYSFGDGNASSKGLEINSTLVNELGLEYSVACWIKVNGPHYHYNGCICGTGNWNVGSQHWAFGVSQDNTAIDVIGPGYNKWLSCPIELNTWIHIACTHKDGKSYVYKNGEYVGERNVSDNLCSSGSTGTTCYIGREEYAGGYFTFNGSINDFRLYNHCLSPKEVKEISKGLVLHYPLNEETIGVNLINDNGQEYSSANEFTKTVDLMPFADADSDSYYTISYDIKSEKEGNTLAYMQTGSGSKYSFGGTGSIHVTTEWQRVTMSGKFTYAQDYPGAHYSFYGNYGSGVKVRVKNIKLEKGIKQYGIWTPYNDSSNIKVHDCSGYGNNGTITGTLTTSTDTPRYDRCTCVSVSNYFSRSIPIPDKSQAFTISFWSKITDSNAVTNLWTSHSNGNKGIFSGGGNCSVYSYNGGGLLTSCAYYNTSNEIKYTYPGFGNNYKDGNWHMYTISGNSGTLKTYLDGIHTGSGSFTNFSSFYFAGNFRATYTEANNISDLRIYSTALSPEDILELYNTSALIDNQGNDYCYEFEENSENYNILRDCQKSLIEKSWSNGIASYTQDNCKCTLTDDGYRVYRTPNVNPTDNGHTMWGGFVLDNTNNRFNFQEGHTYLLEFDVKGQSSNTIEYGWTNWVGWGGGGLTPYPSNQIINNPVKSNFNISTWQHFSYQWTCDPIYKTCTNGYGGRYTTGENYLSYSGFKFGWGYSDTGELGTDIYINNLRMFDITTNSPTQIDINKQGQIEAFTFTENGSSSFIDSFKGVNANQLIEI